MNKRKGRRQGRRELNNNCSLLFCRSGRRTSNFPISNARGHCWSPSPPISRPRRIFSSRSKPRPLCRISSCQCHRPPSSMAATVFPLDAPDDGCLFPQNQPGGWPNGRAPISERRGRRPNFSRLPTPRTTDTRTPLRPQPILSNLSIILAFHCQVRLNFFLVTWQFVCFLRLSTCSDFVWNSP